jgi:hypothetical protein
VRGHFQLYWLLYEIIKIKLKFVKTYFRLFKAYPFIP